MCMILNINGIEFIYIYTHTHTHAHVYTTATLFIPVHNLTTAKGVMVQGVLNGQGTKLLKSAGWHEERGVETFQVSQESSVLGS